MGEIAESMINGEFDYITGEYIGKPTGYPRSYSSHGKKKKYIKTDIPSCRTKASSTNGILKWLEHQELDKSKIGKDDASTQWKHRIIRRFNMEALKNEDRKNMNAITQLIQKEHWVPFMKWVKETYK